MKRNSLDSEHHIFHDQVHRAGIGQTPTEDKYHCDGDRRWMGKTGKGILSRNQVKKNAQDKSHESDHVITDPSPREQSKDTGKN